MPTIRRKKQRNQTTGESAVGIVLDEHLNDPDVARQELSLDGVLSADAWARARATELVEQR